MHRLLIVLAVSGIAHAAVYRDRERSAEWVDRAYLHFRTRIARVEDKWVDVSWPKRYVTSLPPLSVARVHCRAVRATDDGLLATVATYDRREIIASTAKRSPNAKPKRFTSSGQRLLIAGATIPNRATTLVLTVVAVEGVTVDGASVYRCIVLPREIPSLTREAFMELLASGYRLYEWRETRKAIGNGSIPAYRKRYVP